MNINKTELYTKLSEAKKKALKTFWLSAGTIGGISIPLIIYFRQPFFLIFVVLIIIVLSAVANNNYSKIYKKELVAPALSEIFTDVVYIPEKGIPSSVLANTSMIYTGDSYTTEDYVSGKYKDIKFSSADINIQEQHTDSDGNTTYTTIFKGQWMIFDFNKTFKSDLLLYERGIAIARRGHRKNENNFEKVEMEDISFNKNFTVYARNSLEAFYLLTPNTMEKIKKLKESLSGGLIFCFHNNELHIGLNNYKDLYEGNMFRKLDIDKEIELVNEQMKIITNFIDILDLDNDLFRREV